MLTPLKFHSQYIEKIWGGQKIKNILGKNHEGLSNCGESWEISGIEGKESEVADGFPLAGNTLDELTEIYMGDLVGDKVFDTFGNDFPLLVKFIDAQDDLSVQVHPDDALAQARYGTNGKTEMWYIIQADEGAGLYVGFKKGITREQYLQAVEAGTVNELLVFYPVAAGEIFFIPAGTVHAIGKGVLLAEIQQSSDCTYRIFDWNRVDANGQSRELHTTDAVDAIHFGEERKYRCYFTPAKNKTVPIIRCNQFNINLLNFDMPLEKIYAGIDSFIIYVCIEGRICFINEGKEYLLNKGEVMLIPATISEAKLIPLMESKVLESYL